MPAKSATPKKSDKPNILVIWGDDIGISNLSLSDFLGVADLARMGSSGTARLRRRS